VVSLSSDDRAALLLAANILKASGQAELAQRLQQLARDWQPRRHSAGKPRSDVQNVAHVVRQLPDDDIHTLFRVAAVFQPSDLTALVWRRAVEERGRRGDWPKPGPQSNT
jgi:hypothetical protein